MGTTDAGHHKDPLTGWGISDALIHGELLADSLHAGLSGSRPLDEALREYERLRDEYSIDTFERTCALAQMKPAPLQSAAIKAAGRSVLGGNQYLTLCGGGMKSTEFFSRANLRTLYDAAGTPATERLFPTESR